MFEGGDLDDAKYLLLCHNRKGVNRQGLALSESGTYANVVIGNVLQDDGLFFKNTLAHQSFTWGKRVAYIFSVLITIGGK